MTNPLTDVLSPAIRRYLYALLFVAGIVYTAVQASNGDWKQAVGAVVVALLGATAASNVNEQITPH
jgi:hypothetical protein